ncbi:hypothetical protein AAL_06698 [Moelleriella libera RCEF 2490]|uniref:Uncharacterized protein n=1 Tax=Moelleriella libera RCEF 2490 TaxID=1081109 RepID=A0A167YKE4_9HYPO|nr:hypothetical protein AAL_06698 [Moelleriella libera RCEF 2490]
MATPDDPGWGWFPNVTTGWSLDVVNLLVVIGESAMAEHSQAITASIPGMLPRLLPAPQALLKPSRPTRMPETHARMTGVYSGTTLESVGFFANIITPLDSMKPFSFKVLKIEHAVTTGQYMAGSRLRVLPAAVAGLKRLLISLSSRKNRRRTSKASDDLDCVDDHRVPDEEAHQLAPSDTTGTNTSRRQSNVHFSNISTTSATGADTFHPGHSRPSRRSTAASERVQDLLTSPTVAVGDSRPAVPAKLFSPVHILSIFSCLLSIAIVVYAIIQEDGNAILAITLISLASTVVGYASFWRPILMKRKHTNTVPRGDVLIRTREGAFVLVECSEEVARELYSGTEECEYYVGGNSYRALMALGTMMLMVSVVLLGNCTWSLKVFIGVSYIVLNGLYWGLGMIPRSYFWDLSRYTWKDVTPGDSARADETTDQENQREGHPSFTRTLWFAIRETKLTGWVERSGAAPSTEQWREWLQEAEKAAKKGNRKWAAVERKDELMRPPKGETFDAAAQHAPATEVRPPS